MKIWAPYIFMASSWVSGGCCQVLPKPSLPLLNQPCPSSQGDFSRSLTTLVACHWTCFSLTTSFLCTEPKNWTQPTHDLLQETSLVPVAQFPPPRGQSHEVQVYNTLMLSSMWQCCFWRQKTPFPPSILSKCPCAMYQVQELDLTILVDLTAPAQEGSRSRSRAASLINHYPIIWGGQCSHLLRQPGSDCAKTGDGTLVVKPNSPSQFLY